MEKLLAWGKVSRRPLALGLVGVLCITIGGLATFPPLPFPSGVVVTLSDGVSLEGAVRTLRASGVVRSSALLETYVVLLGGEHRIKAGEYLFSDPETPYAIASRIINGEYGFSQVSVTIPEGSSREDIVRIVSTKTSSAFDGEEFLRLTSDKEGYLFPDTYFVMKNVQAETVALRMEENFKRKIASRESEITASGKSLHDILTMASIIEAEATTPEDRRLVSGILWHRIALGMPLQVDAAFVAVNGKTTFELTLDDLKIDSPYNTYRFKGLPPGPINNPGLDAIDAALQPTTSAYLYYLSDNSGVMHYARTFDEHRANKQRYLVKA
ncbi:MAG: hypothetical protein A2675_02975 [Candidatus Yonathbacteria bacterium RIFCSPHIGHO2_01_FULL_51_10]|uniref:Endolytic murein transglycosylase n=1 Tax=Candidatus Yonathbacteria bacterium RIFCSPHIGHO2_01_FULL_51_10 TaxID=1802723 RepID=A0A1G2S6H3_9BACT|nr:MAG: hypothetical protein A2675_02975 [Candidatus Yonathbacteria bacterium RIFCSPHIGHO2_01_FULL_51_10]